MKDSWEQVEKDYIAAQNMSCKPGENFRKVKTGDVIDEERSVRWNREEVERLKEAYAEEVKRLNREKNKNVNKVTDRIISLIAKDASISKEKACVLWNFVFERHHAYGDIFSVLQDYIDLADALAN